MIPPPYTELDKPLQQLFNATSHLVSDFTTQPTYGQNTQQGIYAIFDPQNTCVYIGKTINGRDGLAQRAWDHANGIGSLFQRLEIELQQFQNYTVKILPIEDPLLRGRVELYGIATQRPIGNCIG